MLPTLCCVDIAGGVSQTRGMERPRMWGGGLGAAWRFQVQLQAC